MRWIAPLVALIALSSAPGSSLADPAKPLATASNSTSEYSRDGSITYNVVLAAHDAPLTVRVTQLAVGSLQLPASRLSASLEPAGAAQRADLVLRDATGPGGPAGKAPLWDQGDYTVTVEVADTHGATTPLELRFTRNAAAIKIDAPLKLRQVKPLLWGLIPLPGGTTPSTAIYEMTGLSDVHLQASPYRATLLTSNGTQTVELTPKPPGAVVPAGGSMLLIPALDPHAPVGVATGVMSFQAPELKGGIALVPIEITTRESFVILAAMIAAGLFVGWVARTVLEPFRARQSAAADAWTALERLPPRDATVYDADELKALDDMRQALEAAIKKRLTTPEAIATATITFNTNLDKFLTDRAAALATAAKALDDWSVPLDEGRDQAQAIADVLTALRPQLLAGRAAIPRSALPAAKVSIAAIEKGFEEDLQEAIDAWRRAVNPALDLPDWPEVPVAGTVLTDIKATLPARIATATPPREASAYKAELQGARLARQDLRNELFGVRLQALVAYAVQLRTGFGALPIAGDHADALTAVDQARDQLGKVTAQDLESGLGAYATAERGLFGALQAMFASALTPGDANVAAGKFEAALAGLATVKTDRAMGGRALAAAPTQPLVLQYAFAPSSDAGAPPRIRIDTQGVATVGTQIVLAVVGLAGAAIADDAVVTWRIGSEVVVDHPRLVLTVRDAGTLQVQATLPAPDGGVMMAASTLTVLPLPAAVRAKDADDKAKAAAAAQMAVSAVVVWAGGFMLLSQGFVGTPSQLLTAFLWGFTTDLGITKAFDLAKGLVPATKPVQA